MRKLWMVWITLLVTVGSSFGEENKFLVYSKAPLLRKIYIKTEDNQVRYTYLGKDETELDPITKSSPTLGGTNFRCQFETGKNFQIYYRDFNPLKVAVKVEDKEETSNIYDKGLFFETLSSYKGIVIGSSPQSLMTLDEDEKPSEPECKALFDKFDNLVKAYNNTDKDGKDKLDEISLDSKKLNNWIDKCNSLDGISQVLKDIDVVSANISENINRIKDAQKKVIETNGSKTCSGIPVKVIAETSFIMDKTSEAIAEREAAVAGLDSLKKYLSQYKDGWDGKNYYLVGTVSEPGNDKLKTVTVTTKNVNASYKDNKISIKEDDKGQTTAVFKLHKYESVVYEGAVGFVYTPIMKYNKFSPKTINGVQVVDKTEKTENFHAAAFLNIYRTKWLTNAVYPFLQLGLATAKEYPALLIGPGLKFRDTPFSLSIGGFFAFNTSLDKLSVGSPITGQADIDKDEKTTVDPTWYLSIQYIF